MGEFSKLEWMEAVRLQTDITMGHRMAILDIGATAKADGSDAWRTNRAVAERVGLSERSVTDARQRAAECGLWVETTASDNRNTTVYRLTMPGVNHASTQDGQGGTVLLPRGEADFYPGVKRSSTPGVKRASTTMEQTSEQASEQTSVDGCVSNASASAQDSPSAADEKELIDQPDLLAGMQHFRSPQLQNGLEGHEWTDCDESDRYVSEYDYQDDWSEYAD
ncbi:hypothetical protein [Mycolicibacterium sp. CBMA 226]|uniref:hypothetical protein n=1 Tax=Mycolicibacterium sp. CBMA 226 TaxID=2606611 RepID=UPI0012DBDDFA|nr:hypothetical protein [Mycolicibacterium sp. CBMA 226]MUL78646.1 hypothetical protein [Mycolicibacterium sp. CBMA 226]